MRRSDAHRRGRTIDDPDQGVVNPAVSGYWPNIGLVLILVLLNAAFAGTEMALISLREGQLKQLEREGTARSRRLVRLARDPNRFLATIQIGITLAGFLASATAAVALAEPLVPVLTPTLGGAAEPLAIAGVTLILTFVTLVFGELAPKRLAMQKALPWARLAAGPLDFISTLSKPAVWLLAHATNAVVRLLGGRAEAAADELSSDELREIVTSHRELNPEQREIISGALDLEHRTVREVLVPRGQVFSLRQDLTLDQARTALVSAGHSRAPVTVAGSLDDVVGIVHWSALIEGGSTPVGRVVSELLVFPDVAPVSAALRTFKARRQQLALVVDEHGDADGIVTLEDLLEEVVGEIYDETDKDSLGLLPEPDGSYLLPGTYPLHDLRDLDIDLTYQAGDYTTVAGLVLQVLGRIPERAGEFAEISGWRLEVLEVSHHAITRIRISRVAPEPDPADHEHDQATASGAPGEPTA